MCLGMLTEVISVYTQKSLYLIGDQWLYGPIIGASLNQSSEVDMFRCLPYHELSLKKRKSSLN